MHRNIHLTTDDDYDVHLNSDHQKAYEEGLKMEKLLQKQMQDTQLINHFNNIAEFAKHNDVDAFDYIQNIREMAKQKKDVHFEE